MLAPSATNRPELLHRDHVLHELIDGDFGPLLPTRRFIVLKIGFISVQRREDVASAGSHALHCHDGGDALLRVNFSCRNRLRSSRAPNKALQTDKAGEPAMIYNGSCHCGQISFEVNGDLTQAMECNCSHCSRKGYLLWFLPRAMLTLSSPESGLATYTFNRHVIKHHFCPRCGCAPFGFGTDRSGAATAAVNVRCLEDVDLASLTKVPVDGRSY